MLNFFAKFLAAGALTLVGFQGSVQALVTLDLGGTNPQIDYWYGFNSLELPQANSDKKGTGWTAPIVAMEGNANGGDASLMRTEGANGGGPYVASSSIYGDRVTNSTQKSGSLRVSDSTPVLDLNTIVFQIEFGEADGNDFFNDVLPVLTINGNVTVGQSNYNGISLQVPAGTYPVPDVGNVPLYLNHWFFQWDLSGITEPITSFSIDWSMVGHSQIYSMQLDQSSTAYQEALIAAIPEPSANLLALVGVLGALGLVRRRRRP